MWEWWDDTVDNVGSWVGDAWDTAADTVSETYDTASSCVGDAWDTANDWIDAWVWDTSDEEAAIESWVRSTFDIPDEEGKGFIGEAWDKVHDLIDTYVWDTGEDKAVIEEWVKNTVEDIDNTARDILDDARAKVGGAVNTMRDVIQNIVYNISLALGTSFDLAMAALSDLPDLLAAWKDDLAGWFTFDITEFQETMAKMQASVKTAEVGG